MGKAWKRALSVMLSVIMTLCAILPVFAVDGEEYICELRLIYAEDYDKAMKILEDSDFSDYELLDENLNRDTGEIGVWLAYKTTTDMEDAITDIAVMQMGGGYRDGNYQEMIQRSYDEYVEKGEVYLKAIQHVSEAYKEDYFPAEVAFRQLNFYTVESEGIPENEIPDFEGELLGDIFLRGITAEELATLFMEGNFYALQNIRALLAMGVAYNADGLTYPEKVEKEVEKVTADPLIYANENYHDMAALISPTVMVFRDMFEELGAYEDELNYKDEEFTETEIRYLEYKAIAEMMRDVNYLGGKTLYEFCMEYEVNKADYSALYPLVAALNEGQVAMTQMAHYYDVVRYSVSDHSEEKILDELKLLEDQYGVSPFNVYTGVDRTLYHGSFALTPAADRANAFAESGVMETLFRGEYSMRNRAMAVTGCVGVGFFLGTVGSQSGVQLNVALAMRAYNNMLEEAAQTWATTQLPDTMPGEYRKMTGDQVANSLLKKLDDDISYADWSFERKLRYLENSIRTDIALTEFSQSDISAVDYLRRHVALEQKYNAAVQSAQEQATRATQTAVDDMGAAGALCVMDGAAALFSAVRLGISVHNCYHSDYDDIPVAMVDLIETVNGDRCIKYDVVYEVEERDGGTYAAADLNAFAGHRWNALYYTKSYEAGKPLLAGKFYLSNSSNTPMDNCAPVHRFGEDVCYDLNKYVSEDGNGIYLSIKQSENPKAAVADVSESVGSMFGTGILAIAAGVGLIAGVGGALATMEIAKKKKTKG